MHTGWLVLVAAAAGCVPVPAARNEQPLLVVDATTGRVSTTARAPVAYAVEFGDRGVRTPTAILFGGVNRLKAGACPFEGGVGVNVFPAVVATALGTGNAEAATELTDGLTVAWAGPVVARIIVKWHVPYTCNGTAQALSGTSTFTLFPNSRIVRHDAVTPSTTTITSDGAQCGCGLDSSFVFATFWTFDGSSTNVQRDGTPWVDGASSFGCAVYPEQTIGVSLPDPATARLRRDEGASAFVHDWANNVATLPPTEKYAKSAIVLSASTQAAKCSDVVAELDDPKITIGGVANQSSDDHGIYQGRAMRYTERFEISATGQALPRGFVVSLDIGDHAALERSPPATGDWYATQRDGDRTLVWFRDGLAPGETIAIEPR
jgi:hypothetical protein